MTKFPFLMIIFANMEDYLIFNTHQDYKNPADYHKDYHIHLLCHGGEMSFRLGSKRHAVHDGDLLIWQMTTDFDEIALSEDFNADVLLVSGHFLSLYNPEQIWATKAYVYIKNNPVFPLEGAERTLIETDFRAFRLRIGTEVRLFEKEIIGEMLRIFLYDLWNVYSQEIEKHQTEDITSSHFLHFLMLVQEHCIREREVAWYADKLNLAPKYLSEICKDISGNPASEWIQHYAAHVLTKLLSDKKLSLTDISDRMGFSSQAVLTRYLKRTLGMTPSEFRRKNQIKD